MFPKPHQIKKKVEPIRTMKDGREIIRTSTKAGRDEYERRKRVMWERQGRVCGLQISKLCLKNLPWNFATYDHSAGRGHGGGKRDDRIVVDGKPQNMTVCPFCNSLKGSRDLSVFDEVIP